MFHGTTSCSRVAQRPDVNHKEGRALRIETTINDTCDFIVGRLLRNLPELRSIGFAANRRMLEIEQISHDCALGEDAFQAPAASPASLQRSFRTAEQAVNTWCDQVKIAA